MNFSGKRFLAFLLALVLVLGLIPVSAQPAKAVEADMPSKADYANVDAVFAAINDSENQPAKKNATKQQKLANAKAIVLASDNYVDGSLKENGNAFTWMTEEGIRCGYNPRMRQIQAKQNREASEDLVVNVPQATKGGSPSGNQVYLIGPYYGSDANFTNQYKNEARRVAKAIGDTDGYTLYSGSSATIEKVAEAMSNGAVVFFDSHGTTDYENPDDEYDFITGAENSYLCLSSNYGLTTEDYNDGAFYDGVDAYVNGAAIANHMTKNSPNGILWMAICLGMGTDTLHAPLRAKGVEVVYGYSESVTFDGDYLYEETFWGEMITGKTVAQSVATMKSKWGNWDWSTQMASYYGDNDGYATIAEARNDFMAFPVVVSSEDAYPGQRTAEYNETNGFYGADSLQTVQSTYKFAEVFEVTDPTEPGDILAEAYALAPGEELPYEATLTGVITSVTTAYSDYYGNVTVIMEVPGYPDMPIKCYRLAGTGADKIGVGDTITVTGTIVNYQHSSGDTEVEFTQGCQLVSWSDGSSTPTEPTEPTKPSEDPTEPTVPSVPTDGEYIRITSADQLTTGQYVMVVDTGYAPGVVDGTWITAEQPTVAGNKVTDPRGAVWTLTVTGNRVTLMDANGLLVGPKGGNNNGISSGKAYSWIVSEDGDTFRFAGTGSDTVLLASNITQGNKFRGYKTSTIAGGAGAYPCDFALYKLESSPEEPTDPPVDAIPGDINGDGSVTVDDAVALLLHISMPDVFPMETEADLDGDGSVTVDDAVKLLLHISMPDVFPL